MPRDASGNFTLPTNDSSPAAPRNVIRSSDFNELMGDIASGMTDSLSRSGDGAMQANLDMGNFGIDNATSIFGVAPGAAGVSMLALAAVGDVRNFLDVPPYAATRTVLKALDTTKDSAVLLMESGREGIFLWQSGDFSTQITADTEEGVFIKADAIASTSGAWVRLGYGAGLDIMWFGAAGNGTTNDTTPFSKALALAEVTLVRKVVARDATKNFKIVEAEIIYPVEFDIAGWIYGDFGAWGTSTIDATPIYWTKNVIFSQAANAPSVKFTRFYVNGQNSPDNQMIGGTPLIDLRGAASAGNCVIEFGDFVMTRGANRRYTSGSGISAPTAVLDYRNQEVLLYNVDYVRGRRIEVRSSPGEQFVIQADDARTKINIETFIGDKRRDQNQAQSWSSSSLNIFNCHHAARIAHQTFRGHIKGPVNIETNGVEIETTVIIDVTDSNGIDCCEASTQRQNSFIFTNVYAENVSGAAIRACCSGLLVENLFLKKANVGVDLSSDVVGDPSRGSWVLVDDQPLYNNHIKNVVVLDNDVSMSDLIAVRFRGKDASTRVHCKVDGIGNADRPPTGGNYGLWASNAVVDVSGYLGEGRTAVLYLTGTSEMYLHDFQLAPETGQGVHSIELNTATMNARSLIIERGRRITALDGGQFDIRNTSSTLDLDAIHVNDCPGFVATTNNAVIRRDGELTSSATFDPASIAAGASVSTTVTNTGARSGDSARAWINTTQNGLVISAYVSASNTVTVTYFNPTVGAIDLASHTLSVATIKPLVPSSP